MATPDFDLDALYRHLQKTFPDEHFATTGTRAAGRFATYSICHGVGDACLHDVPFSKRRDCDAGLPLPKCFHGQPAVFMYSRFRDEQREGPTVFAVRDEATRFVTEQSTT